MLNGNLGHLRVSVGIVGFGLQADIADGEDVLETRKLVIFVDENASASSQFFILYLFEAVTPLTQTTVFVSMELPSSRITLPSL